MRPCVNLVVILVTLAFLASALDSSPLDPSNVPSFGRQEPEDNRTSTSSTRDAQHFARKTKRPVALKGHRPVAGTGLIPAKNIVSVKKNSPKIIKKVANGDNKIADNNKLAVIHDLSEQTKAAAKTRATRKRRKTMNQAMMALLIAYKLKFATLIPTLMLGLILLISNTALAGFFFALFAAVLGLKH